MKNTIRKLTALILVCLSLFAVSTASAAGTITYIPVTLIVEKNSVTVEGMFRNTFNYDVGNFTEFELDLYEGSELLISAYFDSLSRFNVPAHDITRHTLVIEGRHNLPLGTYNCNTYDISADFGCYYQHR